jgi:prephenate dehydrogenase
MKENVLIVGLGMMGGSFAQSLTSLNYHVYGYDISLETIEYAYNHHFILNKTLDDSLISQSDLIIICLYPNLVIPWVKEHLHLFKKDVIICDITGVKHQIVLEIQSLLHDKMELVSIHPMCGKETSGVQYSLPNLFTGANLIIIKTENNTEKNINYIKDLGEKLAFAHIEILSIEEHDKTISFLSQLPHVIAVALMDQRNNDHLIRYTGDSYRDLTRIAKINEKLWSELFIDNKENLVHDIDEFIAMMEELKHNIQDENKDELENLLIKSRKRRINFDK